jgi:uroporphyrinogen decarboxylase
MLGSYAAQTGVNGVGLDTAIPVEWANSTLPKDLVVQGNLDPLRLIAGGDAMDDRIVEIKSAFKNRPHIFNLGHGVTPQTPIQNVERAVNKIREV